MKFKINDVVIIKPAIKSTFVPAARKLMGGRGKIINRLGSKPYWLVKFNNAHGEYYFPENYLEKLPNTQLLFEFMD